MSDYESIKDFSAAELDPETLELLKDLETRLNNELRGNIVVIAYQEK